MSLDRSFRCPRFFSSLTADTLGSLILILLCNDCGVVYRRAVPYPAIFPLGGIRSNVAGEKVSGYVPRACCTCSVVDLERLFHSQRKERTRLAPSWPAPFFRAGEAVGCSLKKQGLSGAVAAILSPRRANFANGSRCQCRVLPVQGAL